LTWLTPVLPRLGAALAILAVAIAIGRLVTQVAQRLGRLRQVDPDLVEFLARVGRMTCVALGIVTALGTLGVHVGALVAGLGLTGFALGFALKDIISNLLAGVLILLYKPFHRGDRIEVAGSAGVVINVDLRYTVLQGDTGDRVLVPNASLFTNVIRVVGRST
jgi:small-conductance mechanosensitive channel